MVLSRAPIALLLLAAACTGRPASRDLILATTTSVGNSGLLDVLLPAYERAGGITVRAHLVGSGRALAMLADATAQVVISHAPDAESAALRAHPGWTYRKIMFNDFVIVGPPADPARVSGSPTAEEAMGRIARSTATFISRGDGSGTEERERQLWTQAGATPPRDRLVAAGAGMGTTLRVASETMAYTLTDRATLTQHADAVRLRIAFEGGPSLLNTYAVVVDRDGPGAAAGLAFAEWLAAGGGRDVIAGYRIGGGAPAFTVWPAGAPAGRPGDLPR